jgi:hypothetical protein
MTLLLRAVRNGALALIGATAARADCTLDKISQMPLLSLGNHYAVMTGIEDVVRPIAVDTGAAVTTLTASVVDELSIKADDDVDHAHTIVGIGQTAGETRLNAIPSTLSFGDLVFHDRSTAVAAMNFGKTAEGNMIGLLGDDVLSQYDVEFDFPAHQLTFYREVGCYDTFLPWSGPFATVPFDHRDGKVTFDITLNQERTQAIVDTGNPTSFIAQSAPALWGSDTADLSPTKATMQSPFNHGAAQLLNTYAFAKVVIGGDVYVDKKMGVVDVGVPPAPANLGLDYWSTRKIWIAYPRGWLFVADDPLSAKLAHPVNAPPPPPPAAHPSPTPVAGTYGPD